MREGQGNGDDREEEAEAGRTGDTVAVALCDAPIFVSGVHQDDVDRVEPEMHVTTSTRLIGVNMSLLTLTTLLQLPARDQGKMGGGDK